MLAGKHRQNSNITGPMRTVGSNRDTTEKAIREAAINIIARHGFKAASLRMIAKEVGIQAGSLYNYIKSKECFLFELLRDHLQSMISEYQEHTANETDPYKRLLIYIDIHLNFHIHRQMEVFIGNMELRNLSKPHYKTITGLRDAYSNLLTGLIKEGNKAGLLTVEDPRVTTFAIISLLSGVCYWYQPGGRLSEKEVRDSHTAMVFRLLGLKPPPKGR